jgi:hypothetical protein
MAKDWYKSKLIWAGIVAVVISAYNTASAQFGLPAIPEFVYGILGLFGVYNRATSDGFKNPIK